MMSHSQLQELLYDFVTADLDPARQDEIGRHLSACPECAADAERIRSTSKLLEKYGSRPSDTRPEVYWHNFAIAIQQRIQQPTGGRTFRAPNLLNFLRSRVRLRFVLVAGAALAAFLITTRLRITDQRMEAPRPQVQNTSLISSIDSTNGEETNDELGQYFRQSKNLLVGVVNMKEPDHSDLDFSVERAASRRLLRQGRDLSGQPLDLRSKRLIDDLNRIMIVLANDGPSAPRSNVDFIRKGIHRENLLFKVRLAEARYERPGAVLAKY